MIKNASLQLDAHVHFYDCFEPCEFLEAAYNNLSSAANADESVKILLLTETQKESGFMRLRQAAESKQAFCEAGDSWYCELTAEAESLLLTSSSGKQLYVIAGRQIVCREGLEVHALATAEPFDDGQPLVEVIESINACGAVVALPWGAGKWLGKRGKLLSAMSKHLSNCGVFISDSGIRPRGWPASSLFKAELKVISGTDPLPIADEAMRVGSYGFSAVSDWNPDRPAESVRTMMKKGKFKAALFGRPQAVIQFLLRQLAIRR
jgi:hypothetical protein